MFDDIQFVVKTCFGSSSVLVTVVSGPVERYQCDVLQKTYAVHLLAKCCASLLGTRYPRVTI